MLPKRQTAKMSSVRVCKSCKMIRKVLAIWRSKQLVLTELVAKLWIRKSWVKAESWRLNAESFKWFRKWKWEMGLNCWRSECSEKCVKMKAVIWVYAHTFTYVFVFLYLVMRRILQYIWKFRCEIENILKILCVNVFELLTEVKLPFVVKSTHSLTCLCWLYWHIHT